MRVSGAVPRRPVVLALRGGGGVSVVRGVFVHDPGILPGPSGLLSARRGVDALGGVKDSQTLVVPLIASSS